MSFMRLPSCVKTAGSAIPVQPEGLDEAWTEAVERFGPGVKVRVNVLVHSHKDADPRCELRLQIAEYLVVETDDEVLFRMPALPEA